MRCHTCDHEATITGQLRHSDTEAWEAVGWCAQCWEVSVHESMAQSIEEGALILHCNHEETVRLYRQHPPSQGRKLRAAARLCTRCLQPLRLE